MNMFNRCKHFIYRFKAQLLLSLFALSFGSYIFLLVSGAPIFAQALCAFWLAVQFAAVICHVQSKRWESNFIAEKKQESEKRIHDIRSDIAPAFLLIDSAKAHSKSGNADALEQLDHYLWQVIEKVADNENNMASDVQYSPKLFIQSNDWL